ncbi:MAG: hypothetical protein HYU51_07190 [Candidatus Rokubacteria bacterium]|nr:hypothetical protein [Candidatus Rokubacteria bacterium]
MWYQRVVAMYDQVYRALHGLDRPRAQVPPVLRVEVRRSMRRLSLRDGTAVAVGDRIGVLHLNNAALAELHAHAGTPAAVGLEFRRALVASLRTLAWRARPDGPLADLTAFSAVTILHHGMPRIGFEHDAVGLVWPRVTTAYQRALLASLHPDGWARTLRLPGAGSERLWMSRRTLLALYDAAERGAR